MDKKPNPRSLIPRDLKELHPKGVIPLDELAVLKHVKNARRDTRRVLR